MERSMLQGARTGSQPRAKLIADAPTLAVAALVVTAVLTLAPGWFGADSAMMHVLDDIGTAMSTAALH